MADASFIGLGAMGFALANTAAKSGRDIVVWNRTLDKALPLASRNVTVAPTPAEAISASPMIVVCLSDYETADSVLGSQDCISALKGRILIQLTSGSPNAARAAYEAAKQAGISYLDGEIVAYVDQIGREDAPIYAAGDKDAYDAVEPLLKTLAPQTRYLGSDPAKSSALNLAMLSGTLGLTVGIMNGAAICEAAGVSLLELARDLPAGAVADAEALVESMGKIKNGGIEASDAPIEVWTHILDLMIEFQNESGYGSDVSEFIRQFFGRAVDRGTGPHDVGALVQLLRPR